MKIELWSYVGHTEGPWNECLGNIKVQFRQISGPTVRIEDANSGAVLRNLNFTEDTELNFEVTLQNKSGKKTIPVHLLIKAVKSAK